jgi:hypothetical protein
VSYRGDGLWRCQWEGEDRDRDRMRGLEERLGYWIEGEGGWLGDCGSVYQGSTTFSFPFFVRILRATTGS